MTEERLKAIEDRMLAPAEWDDFMRDVRELVAEVRRLRKEIEDAPVVYTAAPFRLKPIPDLIERVESGLHGKSCLWAVDRQPRDSHQARLVRIEKVPS